MRQPTDFLSRVNKDLPIPVEDAGVVILNISHGKEFEAICEQQNEGKRWECKFSNDELGHIGSIIAEGIKGNRTRLTFQPSEKVTFEELKVSVANALPAKHIVFSDEERYKVALAQRLARIEVKRPKVWAEFVCDFWEQIDTNPVLRDTIIDNRKSIRQPDELETDSLPPIPKRDFYQRRWRSTWHKIKGFVGRGMSCDEISGQLAKLSDSHHLTCTCETMNKIIAAGKAGLLD